MAQQYRIGIVGFGIGGGAAACLLAGAGHQITVFERAPAATEVGAGIVLQLSGQSVLYRLGILREIVVGSEPLEGLHVLRPNGTQVIKLAYEEATPGFCGFGVQRSRLISALQKAAVEAGVNILFDHEMVDWQERKGGLLALRANGADIGPFDFLIAADGSRSLFRGLLKPQMKVKEYNFGAMWLMGKSSQVRGHVRQVVYGSERLLGLLPVGGGNCALFWGLHREEMQQVRNRGLDEFIEEVVRYYPQAEETLADTYSFETVAFATYRRGNLSPPFSKRVICIGDASHSMSPHLGQGANLALMDAAAFADALKSTHTFEDAAELYTHIRSATVRYYSQLSRMLTPFFQSDITPFAWGRDLALPIMSAIKPVRKEMARSMAGIKQGWLHSNMKYEDMLPRRVPKKGNSS